MKEKLLIVAVSLFLVFNNFALAQDNQEPLAGQTESLPPISKSPGNNKLTLNIKGMDILDVLKMLASYSDMNIVVGKNVTGRVTLFLKNVDTWDAFEIILLANELAYDKKGEIIYVITQRDYELQYGQRSDEKKKVKIIQLKYARAEDLSAALNQIKSNLGRIVADAVSNTVVLIDTPEKIKDMQDYINNIDLLVETRIFNLNYALAEKLQAKIQDTITKNIGRIKIDERTNKIAITDYPAKLDEIARVIAAFDEKPQQVLIDAQIIEITPSDKFEMGVDWDFWLRKHFRATLPFTAKTGIGLGATAAVTEVGEYKAVIDLLRTIGDTKILSSPRIMAINNQEAKILVGSKEAYITETVSTPGTGSTVTAESISFVDVGIKLYVTPTINKEGFVIMKIRPEISSHEYKDFGTATAPKKIPIVTTSETETSVMVKDGVTIIIGGLQKEQRSRDEVGIPILSRIPLLGYLFKKTTDDYKKTDLVILLTPHIILGEKAFTDFSEIKPEEGAVAKLEKGNIVIKKTTAESRKDSIKKDDFSEYYKLISDRVKAHALFIISPAAKEKGMVKVAFTISKNGELINEPSVSESSNPLLTPFAIKAVKSASPFPPIPDSLRKNKETFEIELSFE